MAGCFDPFRPRTHSFDLHLLMQRPKLTKFSKLFRSRSEGSMNKKKSAGESPDESPASSPRHSPKPSPGAPHRRRFMRVVRDGDSSGEEYENPHVIRKYTQTYAQRMVLQKSHSLDESNPLPYTVSGHTILKKHSSFDQGPGTPVSETPEHSPPSSKHASFNNEVEVIEYDMKEKIQKHCSFKHHEQLIIEDVDSGLGHLSVSSSTCEVIHECEDDQTLDKINESDDALDSEVFELSDVSSDSDITDQCQALPELPSLPQPHGLLRQLSSGSDSSDCERPTRVKKSKVDRSAREALHQDMSSGDKNYTTVSKNGEEVHQVTRSRKMEVES